MAPDDRVEAGQRQENDDHANDDVGDPALGIILMFAACSPKTATTSRLGRRGVVKDTDIRKAHPRMRLS